MGLVLVDHAFLPEKKDAVPATTGTAKNLDGVDTPPALLSMTPVIVSPEDEPGFDKLPREAKELDRWARSINPDLPTEETTGRCVARAETASNGRSYPLGEIPLMVIRTGNDAAGYAELQRHLLSLSRDSRQMVSEGELSFHRDQPAACGGRRDSRSYRGGEEPCAATFQEIASPPLSKRLRIAWLRGLNSTRTGRPLYRRSIHR